MESVLRITSYNVCYTKLLRCGDEHHERHRIGLQTPDHVEPVEARHLDVEKDDVGLLAFDGRDP